MALLTCCATTDFLLVGGLLALAAYLYLTWTFAFWKNKGVPYVEPKLLFGNLKNNAMGHKTIGGVYAEIYDQLKQHKFGGFFKFRQPALLVCDPDLIKTVLVKEFASFHDNDFHVSVEDDPMFGRNPFCQDGEIWKVSRSQLTPSFTPAKIRPLFPLINEVCDGLKVYLEKQKPGPDGLEAKEVAAKFTTDVVATCTFGVNGNSFTDPNAEFREIGRRILDPEFWKNLRHLCVIFTPRIARLLNFRFFDEMVTQFFRNVTKEAMTYREKNKVTRNDFLQHLINLKNKENLAGDVDSTSYEAFTDEDVAAHSSTFFTEGFETSSTTMAHVLFELAMNPDVMKKLRSEVDGVLADNGGSFNYEMMQKMPYLDMVVSETLRKHPAVQFINRLSTKPFDLPLPDGGVCHLDVGTSVVVPVFALHHDPEHFPDPERFDPERFTEENKERRHKMVYLPFGEGPRICLGMRFALAQVKAGVAAVVTNFDVAVNKKTTVPLVADPKLFILSVLGGIWLDFSKRVK